MGKGSRTTKLGIFDRPTPLPSPKVVSRCVFAHLDNTGSIQIDNTNQKTNYSIRKLLIQLNLPFKPHVTKSFTIFDLQIKHGRRIDIYFLIQDDAAWYGPASMCAHCARLYVYLERKPNENMKCFGFENSLTSCLTIKFDESDLMSLRQNKITSSDNDVNNSILTFYETCRSYVLAHTPFN